MGEASLDELLERRASTRSPSQISYWTASIENLLEKPWVDAETHGRARAEVAGPGWVASPLSPGESYLLLAGPTAATSLVARISVARRGGAVAPPSRVDLDAVEVALRGLAASAGLHARRLPEPLPAAFEVMSCHPVGEIDGASLGVAVAAAVLSFATGRAPRADSAATAWVQPDGKLTGVEGLPEKLEAMRRQWPNVRRVIVAEGTRESCEGIELVPCATLDQALEQLGLAFHGLPEDDHEAMATRARSFALENARPQDVDDWLRLARDGWAIAESLDACPDPGLKSDGAKARIWAALFFLHGGRAEEAAAVLRALPSDAQLPPDLALLRATFALSVQIDQDARAAVVAAEELREQLHATAAAKNELRGPALGTIGRAYMHAGRFAEALPHLQDALSCHSGTREEARSRVYLATCLRLSGSPSRALEVLDDALRLIDSKGAQLVSLRSTRPFVVLERARCLLACGEADRAVVELSPMALACTDRAYPGLGAVATLAVARLQLGDLVGGHDLLERCRERVEGEQPGTIFAQVVAVAIGRAWLTGDPRARCSDMEAAWQRAFGAAPTLESVGALTESWIY